MHPCFARAAGLGFSVAAFIGSAARADPVRLPALLGVTEHAVSDPRSGLGLSGWDPVSYLVDGAPRPGLPGHEIVWAGLAWRFASAANLAAFLRDPEAFAPRFGGFDAAGIVRQRLTAGDPSIFAVHGGRLYLFRYRPDRDRFRADEAGLAQAEANWARLRVASGQG